MQTTYSFTQWVMVVTILVLLISSWFRFNKKTITSSFSDFWLSHEFWIIVGDANYEIVLNYTGQDFIIFNLDSPLITSNTTKWLNGLVPTHLMCVICFEKWRSMAFQPSTLTTFLRETQTEDIFISFLYIHTSYSFLLLIR